MSCLHRLAVAAAAAVLIVPALSGCSSPEARHASHMKRGERYLAEGKLDKAQIEFRSALQIAPGDVAARVMIGHIAEKEGNIREAFGDYRAAVDLAPESPVARASLARIYVFADEPQTALELIEPTLIRFPNDPELLTVRGAARAELKDTEEAFADAQQAVKIAPKNENAIALLASLYQSTRAGGKAVELLKSTLVALPSSIDLREILASVYMNLDEPRLAEEQLIQIVKIAPKDFSHRLKLAQFYQKAKRLDDAERVLKQAVADLPDNNGVKLAYVEFLRTARTPAEGQRILAQFITRDPGNYDLQLGFGALQLQGGDVASSLATYRRIVAKAGERPQALSARDRIAAILATQGHSAEALSLVSEVLQKSPRDRDALVMRGNIELERGDSAASIADLRAVLRDQPDDVPILRTLARAHLINGEPALAEDSLRDAMKAAPKDVAVRVDLAQLLIQSNRYPSAVAILEETVLEAPQSFPAREALARAYFSGQQFEYAARAAEDLKLVAPQRAVGWYLAGLVAVSRKSLDDAATQFEAALKLEPNAIDVVAALVRLEVSRDQVSRAFERANAAVAAQAGNGVAHNMLGELYLATKKYPEAIQELTQATHLAPKLWLPYRNLALAQIASGDLKAATGTYEAAIAAVGMNPTLVVDLAALYERQGRVDDAIKSYRSLHDRSPRLEVAANNLAMLLVTYKTDQVSLNEAQTLTSAFDHSDSASLLDTQGWVRFKAGELIQALAELQAAAARSPKSKVIRYHLAMAQLEAKQFAKARTNLEAALEGGQNFAGAEEARTALAKLRS
jgi:predicted Zn-dependent protease